MLILIITGHNQSYKDQPVACLNKDQHLSEVLGLTPVLKLISLATVEHEAHDDH